MSSDPQMQTVTAAVDAFLADHDPTSMADAQSMVLGWASHNIIENFDEEFFVGPLTVLQVSHGLSLKLHGVSCRGRREKSGG